MRFTAEGLAIILGVSASTIRRRGASGKLKRVKEGRKYLYEYNGMSSITCGTEFKGIQSEVECIDEVSTFPEEMKFDVQPPMELWGHHRSRDAIERTCKVDDSVIEEKSFIEKAEDKVMLWGESLSKIPGVAYSAMVEFGMSRQDIEQVKVQGMIYACIFVVLLGVWVTS